MLLSLKAIVDFGLVKGEAEKDSATSSHDVISIAFSFREGMKVKHKKFNLTGEIFSVGSESLTIFTERDELAFWHKNNVEPMR